MEKEQWENGTCAVSVEGSWNIEIETLKVSEGEIICKINTTGVEIGIVMLDRVTGMPVIISVANKTEFNNTDKVPIMNQTIGSFNMTRVIFILAACIITLSHIFIQILACYANCQ
jgi:hypothetical protein